MARGESTGDRRLPCSARAVYHENPNPSGGMIVGRHSAEAGFVTETADDDSPLRYRYAPDTCIVVVPARSYISRPA